VKTIDSVRSVAVVPVNDERTFEEQSSSTHVPTIRFVHQLVDGRLVVGIPAETWRCYLPSVTFEGNSVPVASPLVPRHFFFLWTGPSFPRMNLVALARLRRQEPTARISVHFIDCTPTTSALDDIASITSIEVRVDRSADILAALPERMGHVSEVFERLSPRALSARSNLVRYAILYVQGGIYLDFDVLAMRPIDDDQLGTCFIGEELVWSADQERVRGAWWVCLRPRNIGWAVAWFVRWIDGLLFFGRFRTARLLDRLNCLWSHRQVNNAIIGARAGSTFIERVLLDSVSADPTVRYATGPTLVDRVARRNPGLVSILPPEHFYFVAPGESHRLFRDHTLRLPHEAVYVHFAASNHKKVLRSFESTGRWWGDRGSIIGDVVQSVGLATTNPNRPESSIDWASLQSPIDERGILL